jgi:hypothetical protein
MGDAYGLAHLLSQIPRPRASRSRWPQSAVGIYRARGSRKGDPPYSIFFARRWRRQQKWLVRVGPNDGSNRLVAYVSKSPGLLVIISRSIAEKDTMRLREFCGSQSCFVVLRRALGSICNGHPASKVLRLNRGPIRQRRRREAEGHSAPRYMKSLLTKTWWGQLMLMLCTS